MDAELTGKKESGDADQDRFRRRSKTTPPASIQFAMSNSLDSRVGSFEEADSGDKSCTPTTDELQQSGNRQQYDVPASFRFVYLGSSVLDKRYTQHMLPWVIAEIRRKNERNQIDLNVKEMTVEAVDCSAASTLFQHKVQTITRCARSVDKKCFAYLTKIPDDVSSCHCYVFEAVEISSVRVIFCDFISRLLCSVSDLIRPLTCVSKPETMNALRSISDYTIYLHLKIYSFRFCKELCFVALNNLRAF